MRATTTKNVTLARSSADPISGNHLQVLKHGRWQMNPRRVEVLAALGPDARRSETSAYFTILAKPRPLEHENVLQGNDFAFHAGDFRDGRDLARAVRETRHLNEKIDRRRDLLANGAFGQIQIGHGDH